MSAKVDQGFLNAIIQLFSSEDVISRVEEVTFLFPFFFNLQKYSIKIIKINKSNKFQCVLHLNSNKMVKFNFAQTGIFLNPTKSQVLLTDQNILFNLK